MANYQIVGGDDDRIDAAQQQPGMFAIWDSGKGHPVFSEDGNVQFFETERSAEDAIGHLSEVDTDSEPPALAEESKAIIDEIERADSAIPEVGNNRTLMLNAVFLVVTGILGLIAFHFEEIEIATNAGERALNALSALFIIALFVERAQQVYISAWRGLGRARIDQRISGAEQALRIARENRLSGRAAEMRGKLEKYKHDLADYRHETRKIAFAGGMILGLIIALVGPRILSEVIVVHGDMNHYQGTIFNGIDILITGGLIGGGAEGIHKVVSLLTDFLDKTRENVQKPAPIK